MPSKEYEDLILKKIALEHQIRACRITNTLRLLTTLKTKKRQVTDLEKKLSSELSRPFRNVTNIDDVLDDLEAVLNIDIYQD